MQITKNESRERTRNTVFAGATKGGIIGAAFMAFVLLANIFLPSTHASPWVRVIIIIVGFCAGAIFGLTLGAIAKQLQKKSVAPLGHCIFAALAAVFVFSYLGWSLEFFSTLNMPGILAALGCAVVTGVVAQKELAK